MKQLDIFVPGQCHDDALKETAPLWQLYVDGAARNNPGPAGAGVYILKNGEPVAREGFFLGSKTNNQAEYYALLLGILLVIEYMSVGDTVTIVSDSELLVRQIKGHYKVRQPELKKLHEQAQLLLEGMRYRIEHVLREQNPVADQLANLGIDQKIKIPIALAQKLGL